MIRVKTYFSQRQGQAHFDFSKLDLCRNDAITAAMIQIQKEV